MGSGVRGRAGRSRLGCLFTLLLLAAAAYIGINLGSIYFRAYAFEDRIRQSARFADQLADSVIRRQLTFSADSLGLPPQAHNLNIVRIGRTIVISSSYSETLDLRFYTRHIRFNPRITANY